MVLADALKLEKLNHSSINANDAGLALPASTGRDGRATTDAG